MFGISSPIVNMNSAFNDSVSESKIEQVLAECAALTRANDPRRALNAGRMIETAHLGQPRVLARVARMYSDLGMQDESARVLRGLQSSVRPSGAVPASGAPATAAMRPSGAVPRHALHDSGDLPSFDDDTEQTEAKSFAEFGPGLPGVPTLLSSAPPPPKRPGSVAQHSGVPAAPSQLPPPPVRGARSSSVPPPQRSAPPPGATLPPPPQRRATIQASPPPPPERMDALPPPPIRSTAAQAFAASSSLPPPPAPAQARSALPPPPGPSATPALPMAGAAPLPVSSVPPPPVRVSYGASSVPPPGPKPMSSAPLPGAFPSAGLSLPPPPSYDMPPGVGGGEWDFDDDDNEPTRSFAPRLVAPGARRAPSDQTPTPASTWDSAMREGLHVLRDKTRDSFAELKRVSGDTYEHLKQKGGDSFEQLKKKSGDTFAQLKQKSGEQLRRISSRPPPPNAASMPAAAQLHGVAPLPGAPRLPGDPLPTRAVATQVLRSPGRAVTEAYDQRDLGRSRFGTTRTKALALAAVAGLGLFFLHRHTRQHQDALENDLVQARPLLWSTDVGDVEKVSEHLGQSFEPTLYGGMANAVAGFFGADRAPFASLEPEAQLLALRQYAVLRLLDPKTDPKKLDGLLDAVKAAQVPAEKIRFAELLPALEAEPGAGADHEKLDASLREDPLALLVSGILLERVGKIELAAERYQAAQKAEADWHLPGVYAARLALLTQGADAGKPQVEKLREAARVDPNLAVVSRGLNALSWVVDATRVRELPDAAKLAQAEQARLPPVLAQVPSLVELVQAMLDEDDDLKSRLVKAIEQADGPALLVQLAGFAAATNHEELVDDAIERVQTFAKGYTPAKALAARMQLSKGDFAAARQTAKAAGLDVSGIDAVEAYENQDAKNLARAIDAMPSADKDKPEYAAILLAEGILNGHQYPNASELEGVMQSNGLWAGLIAADAALDQGDLKRAQAIIKTWAENERTPLHQIRVARYERYKGRTRTAVNLSEKALEQATTSSRALIEHLSALLSDDRLPDAVKLFSDALYKDMLKPYERWVDALLIGKDKGWMAANVITSYLQPPTRKEALGLQLLGLRAMCVAGDPRAGVYLKRLGADVPENPDYLLAKSEY